MIFKDLIFSFFTVAEKVKDCCKDAQGKGVLERFNEVIGKYIDEDIMPFIDNIIVFVLYVPKMYISFLPYYDHRYKNTLVLFDAIEWHRDVLNNVLMWYKIKGTVKAYDTLFRLIGVDVNVVNINNSFTFDSQETFDSDIRTFDSGCDGCNKYNLELTGNETLNPELENYIKNVVKWNKSVTATVTNLTYNGTNIN